jgi:hypothetical protein
MSAAAPWTLFAMTVAEDHRPFRIMILISNGAAVSRDYGAYPDFNTSGKRPARASSLYRVVVIKDTGKG